LHAMENWIATVVQRKTIQQRIAVVGRVGPDLPVCFGRPNQTSRIREVADEAEVEVKLVVQTVQALPPVVAIQIVDSIPPRADVGDHDSEAKS